MFVLDTNILSAIIAPRPAPEVGIWLAGQSDALLFTTSVTQAEMLAGIAVMPHGRRRRDVEAAAQAIFGTDFAGRILPFDRAAASAYGGIVAMRRRAGRATAPLDLMIAAVAVVHGATVVTRDTRGFLDCGVTMLNPWAIA